MINHIHTLTNLKLVIIDNYIAASNNNTLTLYYDICKTESIVFVKE